MGRTSPCAALLPEILARKDRGQFLTDIARELGLSYPTAQAFCCRRDIHFPTGRRLKMIEAELRVRLARGETQQQIANALGVHKGTIEHRVARLGLQTARTGPRSGAGHPSWVDGRRLSKFGYVVIFAPLHPQVNSPTSAVPEHRLVMEVSLGRYLTREEVVHHRDDHPQHNWPENLRLYATNADHLRDELSDRVKATPRAPILGAYGNSQKTGHCPGTDETLAQCPSEIRVALDYYIESHRPTTAHQSLPRRAFLRSGAWRDPFQWASTA